MTWSLVSGKRCYQTLLVSIGLELIQVLALGTPRPVVSTCTSDLAETNRACNSDTNAQHVCETRGSVGASDEKDRSYDTDRFMGKFV